MRIAFSARNNSVLSEIEPHLERAGFFVIVNPDFPGIYDFIVNPFSREAGAQDYAVAELLRNHYINQVVTGKCCSENKDYFGAHGIKLREGYSGIIIQNLKHLNGLQNRPAPGRKNVRPLSRKSAGGQWKALLKNKMNL